MRALVLLGRLLILLFGVDEVRLLRLHRAERTVHPTHSEQGAHRHHLADVAQAAPRELQVGAAGTDLVVAGTDRAAGTDVVVVIDVIDVIGGAGAASVGAGPAARAGGGRSVAFGRGAMQRRRRLAPKPQHHISHFEAKVGMGREFVDGHDLALGGVPGRAIRARLSAAPRHDADTLLMVDALDHTHWWHLAASVRGRGRG